MLLRVELKSSSEKCYVIGIQMIRMGFVLRISNDLGIHLWTCVVFLEVLMAQLASQNSLKGREESKVMHALVWNLRVLQKTS